MFLCVYYRATIVIFFEKGKKKICKTNTPCNKRFLSSQLLILTSQKNANWYKLTQRSKKIKIIRYMLLIKLYNTWYTLESYFHIFRMLNLFMDYSVVVWRFHQELMIIDDAQTWIHFHRLLFREWLFYLSHSGNYLISIYRVKYKGRQLYTSFLSIRYS